MVDYILGEGFARGPSINTIMVKISENMGLYDTRMKGSICGRCGHFYVRLRASLRAYINI